MNSSAYRWLMLAAIAISGIYWSRLARRDSRLIWVYLAALVGAFIGAKVVYLLAEGWMDLGRPDQWQRLATGKTILGGLLGGYAGVEIGKRIVGYARPTGDWFALIAPVGIMLGRVGCLFHGCCLGAEHPRAWFSLQDSAGIDRWPSVPMEMGFNFCFLAAGLWLRRERLLPGQHFHLYLIGYGAFRFAHEFVRAEPRIAGPFTGYHLAALAVLGLGLAGFWQRQKLVGHTREQGN